MEKVEKTLLEQILQTILASWIHAATQRAAYWYHPTEECLHLFYADCPDNLSEDLIECRNVDKHTPWKESIHNDFRSGIPMRTFRRIPDLSV